MAAWSSEIEDKPFGRNLLGERVVMFRDGSGEIHALNAMCRHRNADLSAGKLVGKHIQCPFHGWQYDTRGVCRYYSITTTPPPRVRDCACPLLYSERATRNRLDLDGG